jgi:hypothetical protein
MPKILVVGTEEFEFPLVGENADYGEQVTDWASAVTDALTTVQQPNDILPTQAAINNNQTTFSNIAAFSFDTSEVIAINAEYIINRTTTSPAETISESGNIQGNYNGTSWTISRSFDGDADVEFDITSGGQVQYKSGNMTGTGYVGSIIFKAKVFNQDN